MTALPIKAMNKIKRVLFVLFVLIVSLSKSVAQITPLPPTSPDTSIKMLEIINADRQGYKKIDSVTEFQFLVGHVQMKQENTLFYCDSAVYNKNLRIIEAFGNVHINDNDSN